MSTMGQGTAGPEDNVIVADPPAPPGTDEGLRGLIRKNLFKDVKNSLITIFFGLLLGYAIYKAVGFVFFNQKATPDGGTRNAWVVIKEPLEFYMVGTEFQTTGLGFARIWAAIYAVVFALGLVAGKLPGDDSPPMRPRTALGIAVPPLLAAVVLLGMTTTITPTLITLGLAVPFLGGRWLRPKLTDARINRWVSIALLGASVAAFVFGGDDAAGRAILVVVLVTVVIFPILAAAGMWKTFEKAGEPGWAVLVPIYSQIVLLRIVGRPAIWTIGFFVPVVNLVLAVIVSIDLAKSFGKSAGFGVGLALLPVVFYPLLGFGQATYLGRAADPEATLAARETPAPGLVEAGPEANESIGMVLTLTGLLAFMLESGGSAANVDSFGGLLLTVNVAFISIILCFPIGVVMALLRRSTFVLLKPLAIIYIELIRGVPLITLLFMGEFAIGFFFPPSVSTPPSVIRAIIMFTLFSAAYVAEIVRGGLQSVPPGQTEAGQAVGLQPLTITRRIVLPQALRNSIPALVGQFIALLKDTTLLIIISQFDLLGVSDPILASPEFQNQGYAAEVYAFVAFLFWVICFAMSRASQRLETKLGVGNR